MQNYSPPKLLFNRHLETIYPSLFRKVNSVIYKRERIITQDDDFLDLDWLKQNSSKLVIISHGLEGNSTRAYIKGMAKAFYNQGYDTLAWNYRGCSEELNKQLRFYHSGATDDLDLVINHSSKNYDEVYLIGFSLGGNLTLKYLGEKSQLTNTKIKRAVTFSVPMDLHTSCLQISKPYNWIYANRFLKSLKLKIRSKAAIMQGISLTGIDQIKTLLDFDEQYTAPIHGFDGALDYYHKSSSVHFLSRIKIPALIVSAQNDPFLSAECFPDLGGHSHILFERPTHGGHVGFSRFDKSGLYWSELRALEFIQNHD